MHAEWIAAEHHRLHLIEEWPEGRHKEVALAAIHSSLRSLLQLHRSEEPLGACAVCLSRKRAGTPRSLQGIDLKLALKPPAEC
jgi:hypothetical protein